MHVMVIFLHWMFWWARAELCVFMCGIFLFCMFWRVLDTERFDGWPTASSGCWCLRSWRWGAVPGLSSLPQTKSYGAVTPPVTSAEVQPSTYFMCLCLLTDSQSVMLILRYIMTTSAPGKHGSLTCKCECFNVLESDIFKHPLTHISSIPKGGVEWLLVMLEQVFDVCKAFNLEDLWFLLNDLPEGNKTVWLEQHTYCMSIPWVRFELRVKLLYCSLCRLDLVSVTCNWNEVQLNH